jgi:hypothetical protein
MDFVCGTGLSLVHDVGCGGCVVAGFDESKIYSEAEVLPLAQKDTTNIRVAFSKSAMYCADGFSDPYTNVETPKTMSRIYGKLVNRIIREGQKPSSEADLNGSVQKDVIAEFSRMKSADPDAERSAAYGALGLINIGFGNFNSCVYQHVPKFLAEINKGRIG